MFHIRVDTCNQNNQLANQFGPNLIAIVAEHPDEIAILQQ
jgi:hypothetical protein